MKKKIAVISTYDELCGIAGYTKALVRQLEPHFEVTVFDLDQFLFRHETRFVQKLADKEIKRICGELKNFNVVNIQLEHGTLGRDPMVIYRRFKSLMRASSHFCVTFHTILQAPSSAGAGEFLTNLRKTGLGAAIHQSRSQRRNKILSADIYSLLRARQRSHKVSVILHTKRDARSLSTLYGLKNVFDHPLAFYPQSLIESFRKNGVSRFRQLAELPEDAILLGCFGFVGRYKGIDTAIRALKLLPANYHLAVFGGLHPNEIRVNQGLDPFMAELLDLIEPAKSWFEVPANAALTVDAASLLSLTGRPHPEDLSKRVHFLGSLSDDDFPRAVSACDTVLLPYMEVGQSSSGPMGIATDLRKHIIAARTKAFIQNARYNPGRFSMFEVGNFLQLSQLIIAESSKNPPLQPASDFNCESNAAVYVAAAAIA